MSNGQHTGRANQSQTRGHGLTPKQEAFVRAIFEPDENGKFRSQADAYRVAYNCKNMSDKTVREAASRLMDNSNVIAMLDALKASRAAKSAETVEDAEHEWQRLKQIALDQGDVKAAMTAEANRQKLKGLLKDHIDQTVRQAAPEEHKPDLSNLRQKSRDAAQQTPSAMQPERDSELDSRVTH